MADDRWELGRRQFVSTVGVAAGVAATAQTTAAHALGLGAPGASGQPMDAGEPLEPEVAHLLGDIRPGTRLDRWTVESIQGLHMGAIPVVLRSSTGARFQVDILRRDGAAGARLGVANSPALSLFLANRGDGSTVTDEEEGLGALALRDALARRETEAPIPALLTHRERRTRHPIGGYSVLGRANRST